VGGKAERNLLLSFREEKKEEKELMRKGANLGGKKKRSVVFH